MQKPTKTLSFWFFEGLWLEKITKNQTTQVFLFLHFKPKKTARKTNKNNLLRLNQRVSSKFCFFFVFWFWGFGVIVILYILQAFRYTKITKQGLSYLCVCVCLICIYIYMYVHVSWSTWYKRLWGGSQGGYHIYIYRYMQWLVVGPRVCCCCCCCWYKQRLGPSE